MKMLNTKSILLQNIIPFFILIIFLGCNYEKSDSNKEKKLGIKHFELMGDYGIVDSEGVYHELFLTNDKIYSYTKYTGLISPKDYKYINDTLIRLRYGEYRENKFYNVKIIKLDNGRIKCEHMVPQDSAHHDLRKITNIEILKPIGKEEITLADFFNENTSRFDENMDEKLFAKFEEREQKNVP